MDLNEKKVGLPVFRKQHTPFASLKKNNYNGFKFYFKFLMSSKWLNACNVHRARKKLEFQHVLWARSSHIFPCFLRHMYLPSTKIYLSRNIGRDFLSAMTCISIKYSLPRSCFHYNRKQSLAFAKKLRSL